MMHGLGTVALPGREWNAFGGARNRFWDTGAYGVRTGYTPGAVWSQFGWGTDPRYYPSAAPLRADESAGTLQSGLSGLVDWVPDLGLGRDPFLGIPWWAVAGVVIFWWRPWR